MAITRSSAVKNDIVVILVVVLAVIVEADKTFDRCSLVRRDSSIIAVEPYTIQIENFPIHLFITVRGPAIPSSAIKDPIITVQA